MDGALQIQAVPKVVGPAKTGKAEPRPCPSTETPLVVLESGSPCKGTPGASGAAQRPNEHIPSVLSVNYLQILCLTSKSYTRPC